MIEFTYKIYILMILIDGFNAFAKKLFYEYISIHYSKVLFKLTERITMISQMHYLLFYSLTKKKN